MKEIGDNIRVKAFGGKEIIRRIIDRRKNTIYICTDYEYEKSKIEKREPIAVGFHIKYVID
jgi:hypothetical protein